MKFTFRKKKYKWIPTLWQKILFSIVVCVELYIMYLLAWAYAYY